MCRIALMRRIIGANIPRLFPALVPAVDAGFCSARCDARMQDRTGKPERLARPVLCCACVRLSISCKSLPRQRWASEGTEHHKL